MAPSKDKSGLSILVYFIRNWKRFSLRSLLALVLVVCCALGGWRIWIRPVVERQRSAISHIQRIGGEVYGEPSGPEWLPESVRRGMFYKVTTVDLSHTYATDSDLTVLGSIGGLVGIETVHEVELANTDITDAGVAHLRRLTHLRYLSLRLCKVSDGALNTLTDLTDLTGRFWLDLSATDMSEKGIAKLQCSRPRCIIIRMKGRKDLCSYRVSWRQQRALTISERASKRARGQ